MNPKKTIISILKHFVCIVFSLAIILPFYLVLVNSFKSKNESARLSIALPTEWYFDNYTTVIEKGNLVQGFANSLLYAVVATTIAVIGCAMVAVVINRKKIMFNRIIYFVFLCGIFVPVNYVTLIAVLNAAHLNNTRVGLIIAFMSHMIPFCVFTISNFVSSVPVELDEAAVIDGAGSLNLFFKIILPMLKPVLITAYLLQFMNVWNDFMTPLYLTSSSKLWPMNLGVYNFFSKNEAYWNYVFADIVLTCLPVIIIYLIGQKYIISGLTSGAVKE
ncbi:MAG: carbohydrate ABC transporter permease [Eubacteriales bacterium]